MTKSHALLLQIEEPFKLPYYRAEKLHFVCRARQVGFYFNFIFSRQYLQMASEIGQIERLQRYRRRQLVRDKSLNKNVALLDTGGISYRVAAKRVHTVEIQFGFFRNSGDIISIVFPNGVESGRLKIAFSISNYIRMHTMFYCRNAVGHLLIMRNILAEHHLPGLWSMLLINKESLL